jgi:uncharacterized protein (DUF305 family)
MTMTTRASAGLVILIGAFATGVANGRGVFASTGSGRVDGQSGGLPPVVVQPGAPGQPVRRSPAEKPVIIEIPPATPADIRFMQGMIHHHAQALEMTALLHRNTSREDMRVLARRIDISQADEIKMMRQYLTDRGETVMVDHIAHGAAMAPMPGMLTSEEMAALARARGREFDRLFLTGMIAHHRGALTMVEELFAARGGQEPVISDFASHVDADQRAEISRMMRLLEAKP